eukprot:Gb_38900 [translate_table: standard]
MCAEWRVHSCSSESPVHKAENVLLDELYRIWQTNEPSDEAWLILEANPPKAFDALEIVNGGTSLLEVYGLSEDTQEDDSVENYELLLSTQQVMTLKDLTNRSNRNRSSSYSIPQKLSPVAAQKRWQRLRIVCHQPFGTSEHKACIGLSRINIISCNTKANGSSSISGPSLLRKVEKGCSPNAPTKGNGRDTLLGSEVTSTTILSTKNQLANAMSSICPESKDGKNERKRKLPSWTSTEENIAKDSEQKTMSSDAPHKDRKGKSLAARSDDTAGNAKSGHVKKAVGSEDKGSILSRNESKLNSSISPDRALQQKKQAAKGNVIVASSSSDRDTLSSSSAQGEVTGQGSHSKRDDGSFSTLLEGVVLAISGLVNPERGDLRSQALEMGAEYQPDWNSKCTLLVCAFPNTPKFKQVKNDGGTIVSKEWVPECYKHKKLVEIDRFLMHAGKPWRKKQSLNVSNASDNALSLKQQGKAEKKLQLERNRISGIAIEDKERNANAKSSERLDFNLSDVEKWVGEDLNATMCWLQEQEEKPQPDELMETAIQGIMVCLEDTTKCLKENKHVRTVLDNWEFIPRVVKELAAFDDVRKGAQTISREELCKKADTFRSIYEKELEKYRKATQPNKGKAKLESDQQNSGPLHTIGKLGSADNIKVQSDDDDDATEVMSDDGSKGDPDYDTDDTQVMDEDELYQAQQTIGKKCCM